MALKDMVIDRKSVKKANVLLSSLRGLSTRRECSSVENSRTLLIKKYVREKKEQHFVWPTQALPGSGKAIQT
jgi:hypothetical protein